MNLDHLNKEQQKAATHTDGPLLILAGAGSGACKAHEMTDGRCFSGCVWTEKAEYFACIDGKGQIENAVSVPVVAGQTGDINAVHFFLLYIKTKDTNNATPLLYWILPRGKSPLSTEVRKKENFIKN